MATSDNVREFDVERVIEQVKQDNNGPSHRANEVYTYLLASKKFTTWDLLCFSAEYIASMAGTLDWLKEPARQLVRLIYIAHYIRFKETAEWLDQTNLGANSQDQDTQSSNTKTEEQNGM